MEIALIFAMASDRTIGDKNDLPWHLPGDLQRFKVITMGAPVIMGRNTYDSIISRINKPLPGRDHIVMTRNPQNIIPRERVHAVSNIEDAIDLAKTFNVPKIFIIGGTQVFKEAIEKNIANKMYVTRIRKHYNGDAKMPKWDKDLWQRVDGEIPIKHEKDTDDYYFEDLERV